MPTLIQLDMIGTTPVAGSHLKIKAFKIEVVANDFGYVVLEQETRVEGELLLIAVKHNAEINHTQHLRQQWRRICACYLYSRWYRRDFTLGR